MSIQRVFAALLACASVTACSKHSAEAPAEAPPGPQDTHASALPADPAPAAAAVISIDGSSTVFPLTEAVAEEFQKQNDAKVTIGVSGTGGGFKKFCAGEIA